MKQIMGIYEGIASWRYHQVNLHAKMVPQQFNDHRYSSTTIPHDYTIWRWNHLVKPDISCEASDVKNETHGVEHDENH